MSFLPGWGGLAIGVTWGWLLLIGSRASVGRPRGWLPITAETLLLLLATALVAGPFVALAQANGIAAGLVLHGGWRAWVRAHTRSAAGRRLGA